MVLKKYLGKSQKLLNDIVKFQIVVKKKNKKCMELFRIVCICNGYWYLTYFIIESSL